MPTRQPRLFSRLSRRPSTKRHSRKRLANEVLEPRQLLTTFPVTDFGDVAGSVTSLRGAIELANLNPGLDTIDIQVPSIQLALGEIPITDDVEIEGAAPAHVDIHAAPNSRIFNIDDSSPFLRVVTMNELTLRDGDAVDGGAIFNREDLQITNSTISGNTAQIGGGITNASGRVMLDNSSVHQNTASYEGGGIANFSGQLEIFNSVLNNNAAANNLLGSTFGGAIQNIGGSFTLLDNSRVQGNNAVAYGGRAYGGGVSNMLDSVVHLVNSEVTDNYATHNGGGLFVLDNSLLTSEYQFRPYAVPPQAPPLIAGNIAGEAGGGMYLLRSFADIRDTTIRENITELRGGGISAANDVILDVRDSVIFKNTTNFFMPDGSGGGLYLSGFGQTNGPTVTITGSHIHQNNVDPNGSPGGEFGGGISARYGTTLVLDNTLVEYNKASVSGGGIYASDRFTSIVPQITITHSQIVLNSAANRGGGITMAGGDNTPAPDLVIVDTEISGNLTEGRGGGLFWTGQGSVEPLRTSIVDSVISGNVADIEGGGIAAGTNVSLTIDESLMDNNRTYGKGGGLYLTGSTVATPNLLKTISNSVISNNVAEYALPSPPYTYASGGGLWVGAKADLAVDRTTIAGNRADRYGGGVMLNEAQFALTNSTVSDNFAAQGGGGACVKNSDATFFQDTWYANSTDADGGALHLFSFLNNSVAITQNTATRNQADRDIDGVGQGGGIYVDGDPANNIGVRLGGSIVADNFSGSVLALPHDSDLLDGPGLAGNPPVATTYNFIGSRAGNTLAMANPDLNGNIVGDLVFTFDPSLGPLTNNGGPTLTRLPRPSSLAIDSGDPLFLPPSGEDQRGAPFVRVSGTRIDMGAVETQPVLPGPDLDVDGDADIDDIDLLTAAIANMSYIASYDLNGDGILSGADIDRWLCKAGDINLGPGLSYRPADANLDGFVDGVDFIIWNSNKFLAGDKWSQGDFNADGFIDGQDFIRWNTHKFQGPFPCNPLPLQVGGDDSAHDPRTQLPLPVNEPKSNPLPGRIVPATSQMVRVATEFPVHALPAQAAAGLPLAASPNDRQPYTNGSWTPPAMQSNAIASSDRDDGQALSHDALDAVFSEWHSQART